MIAGLITMFVFSSVSSVVAVSEEKAKIDNREGSVFIETPYVTVKLHEGKPDFFIWKTNATDNKKLAKFHISFTHLAELFGDDLIVDDRGELSGGKIYNLASNALTWDLVTENFTNEIRGTQTSSVLDNGATITFVYHVYLKDVVVTQDLNGTIVSFTTKGLEEIKFDIIINNWDFTPGAAGLVFNLKVHEIKYRHRIKVGEKVNQPEYGIHLNESEEFNPIRNQTHEEHGIAFTDNNDRIQAYFAWTPEADVFDENGTYVNTVPVTTSATSFGQDPTFGNGKSYGKEYINLNLVYPNYGDGLKLVHDPIIGMPETSGVSFGAIALIAIPTIAVTALIIRRKKA